jgi:4-hydroxyacetophenone monooxygenase
VGSSALTEAVARADRRTLAALVVHLAADPGAVPDLGDRDAINAKASALLPDFIEGRRGLDPPDDDVAMSAMRLATASRATTAAVSPEYLPIMREITGIGPAPRKPALDAPDGFSVLIIGAGVTGLLAGYRLLERGFSNFLIAEKSDDVGGTWNANKYPGARVDTPSMLYSYNFKQDPGWTEHFSTQPELLRYLRQVASDYGLSGHIRTGLAVESMRWEEERDCWNVEFVTSGGTRSSATYNAVISAVGLLRVPKLPDIPGLGSFAGPEFHSTEWPADLDLQGKHVAVIGSGATAIQIVPSIAGTAGQVSVFQRTPHWIQSHPDYGKALSGDERQLFELPGYRQWYRFRQFWRFGDSAFNTVRVDSDWPYPERALSAENDAYRERLEEYLRYQLRSRPDLIRVSLPNYPPWGKRMLIDTGWFHSLLRDDVRLINSAVVKVSSAGVATSDGDVHRPDMIVYATGFHADRVMWPIAMVGAHGEDLRQRLDADPMAYIGINISGGPNLFIMSGPYGSPGHGGNGFFNAECQVNYAVECLAAMFRGGLSRLEVREDTVRRFVQDASSSLSDTAFSIPGVNNWFKGSRGRVTTIMWRRLSDIWGLTRGPVMSDYLSR